MTWVLPPQRAELDVEPEPGLKRKAELRSFT